MYICTYVCYYNGEFLLYLTLCIPSWMSFDVQPSIGMHLPELVQPVLTCFDDPDARVRYYACESLYNISKVARGAILVFFNTAFDGLCKVSQCFILLNF